MPSRQNGQPAAAELRRAIEANTPAVKAAKKANTMSRVHRRVIEPIETEQDNEMPCVSAHGVLSGRLALPEPRRRLRSGSRTQGAVSLLIKAGEARHPLPKRARLGLPWGTKPRLILAAPERRSAAAKNSPVIEVESSLIGLCEADSGFQLRSRKSVAFKDQLARLFGSRHQARYDTRRSERSERTQVVDRLQVMAGAGRTAARLVALEPSSYRLILQQLQGTPCRSTRPTWPLSPIPPWRSTSTHGWRSGYTG